MTTPAAAHVVFGERFQLAEAYAAWLTGAGIERGLLGPREAERVWDRHILNCTALAQLLPQGARVADVGSGAGLPGIPLALARPDLVVTLIEPLLRRTTFLDEVTADLGISITVIRARAEDLTGQFDAVVSRAVAPLDRLARWCAPLLSPGGLFLALKGSSATEELATLSAGLPRLGLGGASVLNLDDAAGGSATVIQAHRAAVPSRPRRATKTPRKAVAQ